MAHADGKARVEGGTIVISVDLANLQRIIHGAWSAGYMEPIRITDPEGFAMAMCNVLNAESEDGTTPVHRIIDEAAIGAYEWGEGEEMTEDEAEEMAAQFKKAAQGA